VRPLPRPQVRPDELERLFTSRKRNYDPNAPAEAVLANLPAKDDAGRKSATQWLAQRDENRSKLDTLLAAPPPIPAYLVAADTPYFPSIS
jgi:hypothetical protein